MTKINSEIVKRLAPIGDTLRELYLKSGNECTFPECHRIMINASGVFVGQVCHIEAASVGGERFNSSQTNEERRHFSNLMLMCYDHHVTTNNVAIYTVEILQEMKRKHELKFGDITQKLRESISDYTEGTDFILPKNLRRLSETLEWNLSDEELLEQLPEITRFIETLKKVPIPTRELLLIMLNRALPFSDFHRRDTIGISVSELRFACNLEETTLKEHIHILDKFRFIWEGDPEDFLGLPGINISTYEGDWPICPNLKSFCEHADIPLKELIVNLRFDLLDS